MNQIDISNLTGKLPYTLRNDYLFRALLQKNEKILRGLISSLLSIPYDEIHSIHIENPIILGDSIDDKTVNLDIRVLLNNSKLINVELQVIRQSFWTDRSLFYLCKLFTDLPKGGNYKNLKEAIHIGILDFELFEGEKTFYSKNLLMDSETHRIFSSKFQLNVLSLKNMEEATEQDRASGLYHWAKLFMAETWEELKKLTENSEVVADMVVTVAELTNDEKLRMQMEARERYERDWASFQYELAETNRRLKQAESWAVQAESKAAQAESRALQAESKAIQAESRVVQAESRVVQAESRVVQAESKAAQAESKAKQAEFQVLQFNEQRKKSAIQMSCENISAEKISKFLNCPVETIMEWIQSPETCKPD